MISEPAGIRPRARSASSRVVFAATRTPAWRSSLVAFCDVAVPTLYRNPPIRTVIDEHRQQAGSATTLTGIAADIAALEAVAARVRAESRCSEADRHRCRHQADPSADYLGVVNDAAELAPWLSAAQSG